jgi:hypothetical protein
VKILVVPEDPTYNGYILKPLVETMLSECGKPHASVSVLTNPKLDGYEHAKAMLDGPILDRYGFVDLLLFLPDGDGHDRTAEFTRLERIAQQRSVRLLCCAAKEEVEVWLLAGHAGKLGRSWNEVRATVDLRETIFAPFLERNGDQKRPGGGRDLLMQETLRNYKGLLQRCPELEALQQRICDHLAHL